MPKLSPTTVLAVICLACCLASVKALPPIFHPHPAAAVAPKPGSLAQDQNLREMCQTMCGSETGYLCPIGCQGLYSNKRDFRKSLFDFNSKERDRAQSFDDKMFMELLGRNYDDMA